MFSKNDLSHHVHAHAQARTRPLAHGNINKRTHSPTYPVHALDPHACTPKHKHTHINTSSHENKPNISQTHSPRQTPTHTSKYACAFTRSPRTRDRGACVPTHAQKPTLKQTKLQTHNRIHKNHHTNINTPTCSHHEWTHQRNYSQANTHNPSATHAHQRSVYQ